MVGMAGGNDIKVYVGDQLIGEMQSLKVEYEQEDTSVFDRVYEGTFSFSGDIDTGRLFGRNIMLKLQADELRKERHREAARAGIMSMRIRETLAISFAKARQTGKWS